MLERNKMNFVEELKEWKEMRDQSVQEEGERLKEEIREFIKTLVFLKLQEVYGAAYERNIAKLKHDCISRIYEAHGEDDDFDLEEYKKGNIFIGCILFQQKSNHFITYSNNK